MRRLAALLDSREVIRCEEDKIPWARKGGIDDLILELSRISRLIKLIVDKVVGNAILFCETRLNQQ